MRDIERRLEKLEQHRAPAEIIYFIGADGLRWQDNNGLCTPCPMEPAEWEPWAREQQAKNQSLLTTGLVFQHYKKLGELVKGARGK
jgi:hypothetical protein